MKTYPFNPFRLVWAELGLVLGLGCHSAAAAWLTNQPMGVARQHHTATLLPNGTVLVAGGHGNGGAPLAAAEIYLPATGAWTNTAALATARRDHTATLLPNGQVLVVGGGYDVNQQASRSVELFEPATGTWRTTGTLRFPRALHTAALLANGKVLVAGGTSGNVTLASAELYDPATETWTLIDNPLSEPRFLHASAVLPDGRVYVSGGLTLSGADLYDPVQERWQPAVGLREARYSHTATLLPDGTVLLAGGQRSGVASLASAELSDPARGTASLTTPMTAARRWHSATLLPNGQVLVAGGFDGTQALDTVESFVPASGAWSADTNRLTARRLAHTATLLPGGRVLVTGGSDGAKTLASTEVSASLAGPGAWTLIETMPSGRASATATLLADGTVLVAGGRDANTENRTTMLYDPAAGQWLATNALHGGRAEHTATLLVNGQVLVAGGRVGSTGLLASAELYDPVTGAWLPTAAMHFARVSHTATLLPNGQVLVAGGASDTGFLASAELYEPASGTWKLTGSMSTNRQVHTATLLEDGRVLVAGGYYGCATNFGTLATAELYDPATGSWTATGDMGSLRAHHTATLLPGGRVLAAGGNYAFSVTPDRSAGMVLDSAELYDPVSGTWRPTASLGGFREYHTATLLPDGLVLVAGNLSYGLETEQYDPASETWLATGSIHNARFAHTVTLLPDGRVLVAGGAYPGGGAPLGSAEVYEPGWNSAALPRPVITAITAPVVPGQPVRLAGAQFRGLGGGSGGNTQDSATDFPLVQLYSLASGRTVFVPGTNWSAAGFTSGPLGAFPSGLALVTVFANGVPGVSRLVAVGRPAPVVPTLTGASRRPDGGFCLSFDNCPGAWLAVLAATDPTRPLEAWTPLGSALEVAPGCFEFVDREAGLFPQRFYRVRGQ